MPLSLESRQSAPTFPANALAAVAHPDPYPYYRALAEERPFDFDASLGMWVAAGPGALTEVLNHPALGVRPAGARVPAALASGANSSSELRSHYLQIWLVRISQDRSRPASARSE